MPIPLKIQALIDQLNQELDYIEGVAREGIITTRLLLSRFPDNVRVIELSATLNNALFFVNNFRRRIQITVEKISLIDVSIAAIQEAGEDLSEFLGRVLESKMLVSRAIAILKDLQ